MESKPSAITHQSAPESVAHLERYAITPAPPSEHALLGSDYPASDFEQERQPIDKEFAARLWDPVLSRPSLRDVWELCRPKDWVKNVFVLVPLLFTNSLYEPAGLGAMLVACACFCLWSSAIYLVNDTLDAELDRRHPRKRRRPIASGRVRPGFALRLAFGLAAAAALLAAGCLPLPSLVIGGLYLGNSLAYCLGLKHKVIVDVLLIATGFVLRILAGCAAIDCQPSSWIIICGFSLALVLGFGKRRTEVVNLSQRRTFRPALASYDNAKLDVLLAVCCSICLLSYMLYTVASDTVAFHGTNKLLYTIPCVAYGLFRFVFKVQEGKGDSPTDILLRDRVLLLTGLTWTLSVVVILTFRL